jgi:uncharacterized protein (DUF342 family)
MYELSEGTPQISNNDRVNFYELKLISSVKAGDWLGERVEATKGIPGKSVTSVPLPAKDGHTLPLLYDKSTV